MYPSMDNFDRCERQKVGASIGSRALATRVSGAISFSLHIMLCLVVGVVFKKIG